MERAGTNRTITPPRELVTKGTTCFGVFSGPVGTLNMLDAAAFAVPLPRMIKRFRLKEWQAFQLGDNEHFMLVVLYHMKLACLTQFIYFNKKKGTGRRFEKLVVPWSVTVPPELNHAVFGYRGRGYSITMDNRLREGRFLIDVAFDRGGPAPSLTGHFELMTDRPAPPPIAVSIPFAKNRGMYSYKSLMPMRGGLSIGNDDIVFHKASSFGIIDSHRGYYPYSARYDWCTGASADRDRLTGFNLTDNQSVDPERYNENCLWYDGGISLLPPVTFRRPEGVKGTWLIRDRHGRVDLVFTPVTENGMQMNVLLAKVDYHGPFGAFSGFIKNNRGKKVSMNGFFGMGEKKYLRA